MPRAAEAGHPGSHPSFDDTGRPAGGRLARPDVGEHALARCRGRHRPERPGRRGGPERRACPVPSSASTAGRRAGAAAAARAGRSVAAWAALAADLPFLRGYLGRCGPRPRDAGAILLMTPDDRSGWLASGDRPSVAGSRLTALRRACWARSTRPGQPGARTWRPPAGWTATPPRIWTGRAAGTGERLGWSPGRYAGPCASSQCCAGRAPAAARADHRRASWRGRPARWRG